MLTLKCVYWCAFPASPLPITSACLQRNASLIVLRALHFISRRKQNKVDAHSGKCTNKPKQKNATFLSRLFVSLQVPSKAKFHVSVGHATVMAKPYFFGLSDGG